ncbi:hypothetical protein [Haloferula sargassicola]|uniref:Uncharacterized protein n=1 Tax=Haloferula sargassicola TaxID=490096 RepID=A0ABP9UVC4_9BACT
MFSHSPSLVASLGLIGGLVLLGVLAFALSGNVRCPLCHVPILRRSGATMNSRHRRTVFGSPRLYVATRVAFGNHFRCPYCGEPCETTRARRP